MTDADSIITLRQFPNAMLAEIARTTLEAYGIPAIISQDDCGGFEPNLNIASGARLRVHQGNAQAAVDILDSTETMLEDA